MKELVPQLQDLTTWSRALPAWTPFSSLWNRRTLPRAVKCPRYHVLFRRSCLKGCRQETRTTACLQREFLRRTITQKWKCCSIYFFLQDQKKTPLIRASAIYSLPTGLCSMVYTQPWQQLPPKQAEIPLEEADTSWSDRHVDIPEHAKGLYKEAGDTKRFTDWCHRNPNRYTQQGSWLQPYGLSQLSLKIRI